MNIKYIVERHPNGYIAYPLGVQGVVAGQGDTYEKALNDAKSALYFHIETFGKEVLDAETMVMEAFIRIY
jgi:predicted RNase H-like HicB family nuclease